MNINGLRYIHSVNKIELQTKSNTDKNSDTYYSRLKNESEFGNVLNQKINDLRTQKYTCCDCCKLRKDKYQKVIFADMQFNVCDKCYAKYYKE